MQEDDVFELPARNDEGGRDTLRREWRRGSQRAVSECEWFVWWLAHSRAEWSQPRTDGRKV